MPSPSLFHTAPDPSPTVPTQKMDRSLQQSPQRTASKPPEPTPGSKRKLSKSRNGCVTCKAKRLKCDETKPSCNQCARRSVPCGGYKRDFKWRPFEEANFTGKSSGKSRKGSSPSTATVEDSQLCSPVATDDFFSGFMSSPFTASYIPASSPPFPLGPSHTPSFIGPAYSGQSDVYVSPLASTFALPSIDIPLFDSSTLPIGLGGTHSTAIVDTLGFHAPQNRRLSSTSLRESPRLINPLQPVTKLSSPPEEYSTFPAQYPDPIIESSDFNLYTPRIEEDVEEIIRGPIPSADIRPPSPAPSSSSSSASQTSHRFLIRQPQFPAESKEMLFSRFDQDTCGVLSVKNGRTENPWRTLVGPLARDCAALEHAISSLASFHQSKELSMMRKHGIEHVQTSLQELRISVAKRSISVDAAIATSLTLAFSESWDQHIRTGLDHIRAAKTLINYTLVEHQKRPKQGDELDRLRFLCNTWIYMDVIARLTSADDDDSDYFDTVFDALYSNGNTDTRLDPLMGCASSLFPIIGRVANLARKIRRTDATPLNVISYATGLKRQLENWTPPSFIEDPEDETTSPDDIHQTALAYQYATLLYLHQAVPEIPSLPAATLAEKVLRALASVNVSSRAVIVSIYPLMAAGCEATSQEDREWVRSRWELLSKRMKLGITEKCLEVTKEVWGRRNAYAKAKGNIKLNADEDEDEDITKVLRTVPLKRGADFLDDSSSETSLTNSAHKRRTLNDRRMSGMDISPLKVEGTSLLPELYCGVPNASDHYEERPRRDTKNEELDFKFTVRGRLHWLSVMKEWKWEVLLG